MVQSPQDTEFKKAAGTESSSDFDEDDDDVEHVEYEIAQAESRVQVTDRRKSHARHASSKVGTIVQDRQWNRQPNILLALERKEPGRVRDQGLVRNSHTISPDERLQR